MVVKTRKKSELKGIVRLGTKVDKVAKKSVVVAEADEASRKPAAVKDLSSIIGTIGKEEEDVDVEAVATEKAEAESIVEVARVQQYTGVIFLRAARVSRVNQPAFEAVLSPR